MLNEEVEDYEDDDEAEAADAPKGGEELMKCLKCDQYVLRSEILHPVTTAFDAKATLFFLFHDACYKQCTSVEVDRLVREAKYLHILHDTEEDDFGHC